MPLGRSLAQSAPTIEFVNPAKTSSVLISDKERPYHINAWVSSLPTNPVVEFTLVGSGGVSTTIGPGEQTDGRDDTFEFFWTIPDTVKEGTATLRAVLFQDFTGPGTGTEVARTEMPVRINNRGAPGPFPGDTDAAGETVEIIYPENGGDLGVYITPDGSRQSFIVEVVASSGTPRVQAYYSTAKAGTAPGYKVCGGFRTVTGSGTDPRTLTFECVVPKADFALDVTAVAVVPNDTPAPAPPQPDFTDSGDGHTVDAYFQRPQAVVNAPTSAGNTPINTCQRIASTVTDQFGRPIASMNVDVHAVGPTDSLRFDTSTRSDPRQAPDSNHTATEPGGVCNADSAFTGTGGTQGVHSVPLAADEKHIESTAAVGTDVTGTFEFQLASDAAGSTQVTVWADQDNDDQLCAQEPRGVTAIGWGQAAPAPVSDENDVGTCLVAEPTPGATPTESPTEGPSTSASPSGDPSPTSSPSTSPTPDPSGDRRIGKFSGNKTRVQRGRFVRFTGRVFADEEACSNGVKVKFKKKVRGKPGGFRLVSTKTTDANGDFAFKSKVFKRTTFRVDAPPESFCDKAVSRRRTVRIKR
jgi:hypothetical protein